MFQNLATAISIIGRGDGEPVIVLPGGPCRDPKYLDALAGLGEQFSLIVMHPRGTPSSGGLSRGWWTDADDVIALMDELGVASASLLAHSAGTRLALATTARFPGRVRSMTLITPPATWLTGTASDADAIASQRSEPEVAEALVSLNNDSPETEEEFRSSFIRQAPASYTRWTDKEQAHARLGDISLAAASAWFRDIPQDAAERIKLTATPPTLVIGGEDDCLTGVQPVRDYAATLGADSVFIAHCGHYPWIEQPTIFRDVVESWLSDQAAASTNRE